MQDFVNRVASAVTSLRTKSIWLSPLRSIAPARVGRIPLAWTWRKWFRNRLKSTIRRYHAPFHILEREDAEIIGNMCALERTALERRRHLNSTDRKGAQCVSSSRCVLLFRSSLRSHGDAIVRAYEN
jgi:hypothetical protein